MQPHETARPRQVHAKFVTPPEREGKATRHSGGPLRLALAGAMALVLLPALLLAWYEIGHAQRVYSGVSVLGKELGGMSRDEAAAAITAASAGYPMDIATVSGAGAQWTFSPADLGVAVDVPSTVDAAMGIGRSGNFFENLPEQARSLVAPRRYRFCDRTPLPSIGL